jgi:hypothetical protein
MTRERRWQVMEHAAWRRIGHDHAYMIAFGPYISKMLGLLAVAVGLGWLWIKVPHHLLGLLATGAALATTVAWVAYAGWANSLQKRMARRASGQGAAGVGLGWAVCVFVVLLSGLAWLSLGSRWA